MFEKRADYKLIDAQPLNTPDFSNLAVDQDLVNDVIRKIASQKQSSEEKSGDGEDSPNFDLQAEIETHPDSLFIKCFAIKADETNDNGDFFSHEQLREATPTFVGVPLFTNHANADINEARGKVVHSWWDEEKNGIMIIGRVDAAAYPQLARGIKEEYVVGTSMGCFTGNMRVLTANGEYIPIEEIQPGDLVYTHLGNIKPVINVQKHLDKENGFIYQIKAEGIPETIECTKEHPFFVLKEQEYCCCGCGEKLSQITSRQPQRRFRKRQIKGHYQKKNIKFDDIKDLEFCWKEAKNLREGDFVSFPIPSEEIHHSDATIKKARLIGYFLAEGSFNKSKGVHDTVAFSLSWKERDTLAKEIAELLQDCFPHNTVSFQKRQTKGTIVVLCYGQNVANWFLDYCGEYSHKKRLNAKCLTWPKEIQKHLIGSWMAGDGHQRRVPSQSYHNFVGTTVSEVLRSQIQLLLARINIRTTVCVTIDGKSSTLLKAAGLESVPVINGSGAKSRRPSYAISIKASYAREIADYISPYTHKLFLSNLQKEGSFRRTPNHLVFPIQSITKRLGDEPVYNLEVEDDHSYIVEGMAVKNCQVQYSICSVCHNYAETPDQYCQCIRERKTRQVTARNQKCAYHERGTENECPLCSSKKGEEKKYAVNTKVFEYNYGIKFIENSFVVNPACPECGVTEIIDPKAFRTKVAEIEKILPGLLKATQTMPMTCTDHECIKIAGQQEIDSLNQALDLLSSVSQAMLSQKEQIDLEFLSDLVKVLADLQTVTDELTEQGYGRLQSPGQPADPNANSESVEQGPTVTNQAEPMNPTPGGGSKIHTGPAGQVGNVTSPLAKTRKIKLEKLASNIVSNIHKINIPDFQLLIQKEESNIKTAELKPISQSKFLNLHFVIEK